MSKKESTSKPASSRSSSRRRRRWPLILIGIGLALVLLGGAGFVGATSLEEQDSFCASCHNVPETTYYDRVTAVLKDPNAAIPDLASAHYSLTKAKGQTFACINCHRGDASLSQRIQTMLLGANDILINISGKADPTIEKTAITQPILPNSGCMKCHTDSLLTLKGLLSHFHNFLPQTADLIAQGKQLITSSSGGERFGRLRTVDVSLTCTDCHLAHITQNVDPQLMLVEKTATQKACDACHQAAGQESHSLDQLLRRGGEDR